MNKTNELIESFKHYRRVGETKAEEALYQSPDGVLFVEKDHTRLVIASVEEIEQAIIER